MFAPNVTTSRSQIAVMLWRMEGSTASESENLFADVDSSTWYGPAVLWASRVQVATMFMRFSALLDA